MDKRSRHDKAAVGVGGRLRQRLAQILVRSSCATTSVTTAFVGLASTTNAAATVNAHQEPPTPAGRASNETRSNKPNDICQRPDRRRSTSVHISIDCSAHAVGAAAVLPHSPMPMPAKGGTTKAGMMKKSSRRSNNMRAPSYYYGGSSSSTDVGELAATLGSDDGDDRPQGGEADTAMSSTLFSSRSFSSDSTSDFYTTTTRASKRRPRRAPPIRPDGKFRRPSVLAAADDSKLENNTSSRSKQDEGSMAVVKQSYNPYADFRSSMVEMVAGRRIRGADALTELLVWYLSLNSPRHHPVILSAFHDVWEAVVS